jgi:hypothetical protein
MIKNFVYPHGGEKFKSLYFILGVNLSYARLGKPEYICNFYIPTCYFT